jgi:hypothetical protein
MKQKVPLYFDANFPRQIINDIRANRAWKRRCSIHTAVDLGHQHKDDKFHVGFCKAKKDVLVTLDNHFMNDAKYPFSKMPGIIRIAAAKNDGQSIQQCLATLLDFISSFPAPRMFVGDTKFQVGPQRCLIRGRDSVTGEIKSVIVKHGDSNTMVMEKFSYFQEW